MTKSLLTHYNKLIALPKDIHSTRAKVFVGTIISKGSKILLIREEKDNNRDYSIPGGKLLWGELITDGAVREALEETGYKVKLVKTLGIYQRIADTDDIDYFRFIFTAKIINNTRYTLKDKKVTEIGWFSFNEIKNRDIKLRSVAEYYEIMDYYNNKRYPLNLIGYYRW